MTATTTDDKGNLISQEVTVPTVTVMFGRKNGLPNYSNEEMSIFVQVPLTDIDTTDLAQVEKLLDPQVAFVKGYVYKQLGVEMNISDAGVVVGEIPTEAPAKARKGGGARRPAPKPEPGAPTKDDLWAALAGASKNGDNFKDQNGETIWDNREGKRNPKAPDFKFADSGEGLWLTDAPSWFVGPGEGITV